MGLVSILTDGPFYVSYRESFVFYFSMSCLVSALSSFLSGWVLRKYQRSSEVVPISSLSDAKPLTSQWIIAFVGFFYLAALVCASPLIFVTSSDLVPQILIAVSLYGVVLLMKWALRASNAVIASFSLMAFWSCAFSLAFFIQIPTMFDILDSSYEMGVGFLASLPLSIAAIYSGVQFPPVLDRRRKSVKHAVLIVLRRWNLFWWLLIGATTGLGMFLTVFFAGICISPFASTLQGPLITWPARGFGINTRFLRSFSSPPCRNIPASSVCHIYLTAGPDLSSSLFINVHMAEGAAEFLEVEVLKESDENSGVIFLGNATVFETPLLEAHYQRQVFSVFVSELIPNTEYTFRLRSHIGVVMGGGDPTVYRFRTPSLQNLSLVSGGDAGNTRDAKRIISRILETNPDIIVIGGDVAYDNGMYSCACVWDEFLSNISPQVKTGLVSQRGLIPLSFAVGNHDIGYNDNNGGAASWLTTSCDMSNTFFAKPLFFAWFPFQVSSRKISASIVEPLSICERSANRLHSLEGLVNLWILDSGYISSPAELADFVDTNMVQTGGLLNLAFYHVPLFPVSTLDFERSAYLRNSIGPNIFDKHNFTINFENHVHMWKRTVPLRAGETVRNGGGTVYVGDGNMGVETPESKYLKSDPIFVRSGTEPHFYLVELSKQIAHVNAINQYGLIIDSFKYP